MNLLESLYQSTSYDVITRGKTQLHVTDTSLQFSVNYKNIMV